jgi:hypothetical protein
MEVKFIITKDGKHFKSDWLHHQTIARDNGYSEKDVIEAGMILDGQMFIIECNNQKHIGKHSDRYIGNALVNYSNERLISWMRGRELESQLYYSKNTIGLREGD